MSVTKVHLANMEHCLLEPAREANVSLKDSDTRKIDKRTERKGGDYLNSLPCVVG